MFCLDPGSTGAAKPHTDWVLHPPLHSHHPILSILPESERKTLPSDGSPQALALVPALHSFPCTESFDLAGLCSPLLDWQQSDASSDTSQGYCTVSGMADAGSPGKRSRGWPAGSWRLPGSVSVGVWGLRQVRLLPSGHFFPLWFRLLAVCGSCPLKMTPLPEDTGA